MAYKWENAHDWLFEKAKAWNKAELNSVLETLALKLDDDAIQDLFQIEMDQDGYFDNETALTARMSQLEIKMLSTAYNKLTELLKPFANDIEQSAKNGNKNAQQVISLYEMHRVCPNDPGASALCEAFFKTWKSEHYGG